MDATTEGRDWVVIVPVKRAAVGKTRLRVDGIHHPSLVRAIALDTIEAVAACRRVAQVVVVTADEGVTAATDSIPRVRTVRDGDEGLTAAITRGVESAPGDRPRAVLLGDLPALRPMELETALELAVEHPLAFIPDADGAGSVLATARAGVALRSRFGGPSASAHREAGFAELAVPAAWGLRRDLDLADHLPDLRRRGLGPRTAALLEAAPRLALAS